MPIASDPTSGATTGRTRPTGDSTRLRGSEGDAAGREPLLDQLGGGPAVPGERELVGLLRCGAEPAWTPRIEQDVWLVSTLCGVCSLIC